MGPCRAREAAAAPAEGPPPDAVERAGMDGSRDEGECAPESGAGHAQAAEQQRSPEAGEDGTDDATGHAQEVVGEKRRRRVSFAQGPLGSGAHHRAVLCLSGSAPGKARRQLQHPLECRTDCMCRRSSWVNAHPPAFPPPLSLCMSISHPPSRLHRAYAALTRYCSRRAPATRVRWRTPGALGDFAAASAHDEGDRTRSS